MSTLILACSRGSGAVADAADVSAVEVDAGDFDAGPPAPPAPRELPVRLAVADGGLLLVDQSADVDEIVALDARIDAPLKDYRVRLIDEAERVVPSDDRATESDAGIDYHIELVEPLKPGRTYVLSFDAQTGAVIDDAAGNPYRDLELKLKVRGERQPEPRQLKKTKKRRR